MGADVRNEMFGLEKVGSFLELEGEGSSEASQGRSDNRLTPCKEVLGLHMSGHVLSLICFTLRGPLGHVPLHTHCRPSFLPRELWYVGIQTDCLPSFNCNSLEMKYKPSIYN